VRGRGVPKPLVVLAGLLGAVGAAWRAPMRRRAMMGRGAACKASD